jgi:hypothetical protein
VPSFDALKNKQRELIRKSLDGAVFIWPATDDAGAATPLITDLTVKTGTAPNEVIDLSVLPTMAQSLGLLTNDGASFASEVTQSDVTSWGEVSPTRTDIISDTTTLTVTAQETKALTIGILSGVDVAALTPDPDTGEINFAKPTRPTSKLYRGLSVAVDLGEGGEIYLGRLLPKMKKSNQGEQVRTRSSTPSPSRARSTTRSGTPSAGSSAARAGRPSWKRWASTSPPDPSS